MWKSSLEDEMAFMTADRRPNFLAGSGYFAEAAAAEDRSFKSSKVKKAGEVSLPSCLCPKPRRRENQRSSGGVRPSSAAALRSLMTESVSESFINSLAQHNPIPVWENGNSVASRVKT